MNRPTDRRQVPAYMNVSIETKLEDPKAKPLRGHASDAGADLFSSESTIIYPGEQQLIDTGVAVKIPLGNAGLVIPRSSQGKIRVQIANGIGLIDSDYRGNIKVLLFNAGTEPYEIHKYITRIAQLVILAVALPHFLPGEDGSEWNDTVRGTGGFGSTGV